MLASTLESPKPVSLLADSPVSIRLWDDDGVHLKATIATFKQLTVFLYGAESWVLGCRYIRKLDQFHM